MSKGRINDFYTQYEELTIKFEKQEKLLKETNKLVTSLNQTIESLNNTIKDLKTENDELKKEILRLKSKNNKDSSNSSRPSSTNGYKKVITNRREKSNKPKGAQIGHKPHSLNNKLEQFIESGNIEEKIIEVNKTEENKNKRYIEKIVIDIKITKVLKRYRYYPDKHGKYNIPSYHNQNVQYGNVVKSVATMLLNDLYNSTDGVVRFISNITNGGITLSKGTLILWNTILAKELKPETQNIERKLLDSYYLNHDESQIKIDGDGYNALCACNKKYTRIWINKHKSREALNEINFLPKYLGVIVKDGTKLYNPYGCFLAQCISHIQRYLKGIYDNISHKYPKLVSEFLTKCNNLRNKKISENVENFTEEEYSELLKEYDNLMIEWENEWKNDKSNNYLVDEERALLSRMKDTDKNEILYFLSDFKVPSTNNQAETDQRNIKIKQKIGKFRSTDGAQVYADIRSCINTYRKNKQDIFVAFMSAFNKNPIII